MIKRLLPLLIAAFVFCGCSKDNSQEITVYGTVLYGANPLQGASVSVYYNDQVVGQTVSGSDGAYEVVFTYTPTTLWNLMTDEYKPTDGEVRARYYYGSLNYEYYDSGDIPFTFANSSKVRVDISLHN